MTLESVHGCKCECEEKPAQKPNFPIVSVVLPVFNRAHLVGKAIDSVLAQTYTNFELIIVDDYSTDNTREVLERYRENSRVVLVLSDENLGGSGARNLGIEHSRGDLIAFQDSDDVWLPMKLSEQVKALEEDPDAGLCYCGAIHFGSSDCHYIPEPIFEKLEGDMSQEILRRNTTSTQTMIVRRDVLSKCGVFDPSFKRYQDWDLVIRAAQVTKFLFQPNPMVIIFCTPNNISSISINDAIFRSTILEKYKVLFKMRPDLAARNHYISGSIWLNSGEKQKGRKHFKKAFELEPRLKSFLQVLRTYLPI